ncbi:MAG: 5'-methylthioadenosine/S-adenosylhomocysteine nucleosidase [Acidimicrobiales bacterium]
MSRRLLWVSAGALVIVAGAGGGAVWATTTSATPPGPAPGPVGILSAVGFEQAPILAAMQNPKADVIDGYTFYTGTIGGKPVVDAFSGEIDESAELAATLLIQNFHPRAMLFSGTAGANAEDINVGDVVLSAFVADKSNIHYQMPEASNGDQDGPGYQTPYEGVEVHTPGADLQGADINSYDTPPPTPADASTYGYGSGTDPDWAYVSDFAGTQELLQLGETTGQIGTDTQADATGDSQYTGTVTNKIVAGVIGQAPVWTEPLSWIEAQNALYETDAEENEGTGFAYASAAQGIPWLVIRGISDTPWWPNSFDGVLASDHAAQVAIHIVENLPSGAVSEAAATFSDLSPASNAAQAGYIVASQADYAVSPVGAVTYTNQQGVTKTIPNFQYSPLGAEYRYPSTPPTR